MITDRRSISTSPLPAAPDARHRLDLRVLVLQHDLPHRALLDPVAVHVDRLEDALRQVLLHGRRELRDQEVQGDRALLPLLVVVAEDRGEERVGADEALGLALERDLFVLAQFVHVHGDAAVQDGVELLALHAVQVPLHELPELVGRVHLGAVQVGLRVVKLVGVGLVGQDRGAVVGREGLGDGLRVVQEVEHEHIVLLPVRPVEPRQRLHRLDPREGLVDVHGVEEGFVVAGLELVRADVGVEVLGGDSKDVWHALFEAALEQSSNGGGLVPYWLFPLEDGAYIERHVPARGDEPPRDVCPDRNVTLVACYWRRAGYHSRSTVLTLPNAGSRHPSSEVPAAISPKIRAERLRRVFCKHLSMAAFGSCGLAAPGFQSCSAANQERSA